MFSILRRLIYIYGVPGAGKTATVERVIKRLQIELNKKINKFTVRISRILKFCFLVTNWNYRVKWKGISFNSNFVASEVYYQK